MAHLGIVTRLLPDGTLVAENTTGGSVPCPHCRTTDGQRQDLAKQATCEPCAGRGVITQIPFCDRQWDQVMAHPSGGGLWLGGHDCQPGGGDAKPRDRFDVVISLFTREGHEPAPGVEHHTHTMVDGPLDPADHARLDTLAETTRQRVEQGQDVMVRCQAGMNRSGLVAGMAMIKMGWRTDDVLARMRAARGPWVLFNTAFVDHLRTIEDDLQRRETPRA
ncbi:hypothetical protein ASF47_17985 [Nocardioides sp. Leaf285]|nr:hypothetical protein ASF47_17985 [Nocardioides sp. Leaf285]